MIKADTLKIAFLVSTIAATAIAGSAGFANAQDRGGVMRGMDFATLDADGSGEITEEDLVLLRERRFSEIDANGDGAVSEAEFVAHSEKRAGERAAAMFKRLDADGDGSLSRDALEAREGGGRMAGRLISRADTNNSGGVDAEEFSAAMERFAQRGGKRGDGGRR